jgi:hypothetical protein
MPSLFTGGVKSCTRVEPGTRGSADNPVRILGKRQSQDPEFQKEYLKLVGEEPTSVVPNETKKLTRELLRDPEIVTLFKRSATNV